ncbi:MAG: alpha-amylase family glycosyl hydrolase [Verrucomicrobiota bacterium]
MTLLAAAGWGRAAEVAVTRVEPPSWWAGHTHNPVRLLLTGRQLTGATLSSAAGLSISNVTTSASGEYVFCDVFIAPDSKPGPRELKLKAAAGTTTASFKVLPTPTRAGRYAGFTPDDVIYLLMPDRFANGDSANDEPAVSRGLLDRAKPRNYHGGDFQGVIHRLPYLHDLGVTALWLTPWYDNVNQFNTKEKYTAGNQRSASGVASTDYHGYGAVDFYGVEEHFGDLNKLCELVDQARVQGFKFVQDQVANHTGPYHPWAKNPPTPTWFNGSVENHLDNSWQIWTIAARNPPADKLKSTLEGWFINILPDLNQNDSETATYLIQNSLWWIGMTGVDAVRQDTLPYVPRSYWSQWTRALKREYPQLTILGEMWDGKPELVAFFQGGRAQFDGVDTGVETLFDFPLYFAIRDVFAKGQPFNRLAQVIAADTNYVDASRLVTFLGLHDVARFMSEPGATREGLQLAFTYLLTARGTPLIYYGDEIALPGGGDPDNRRDFPGGWPEDKQSAFEKSSRTAEQQQVFAYVKKLLALRRELEPLRRGKMLVLPSGSNTGAFVRTTENSAVIVAFNNNSIPETLHFKLSEPLAAQPQWFNRLADDQTVFVKDNVLEFQLPPRSAAIFTPQPPLITQEKGKTQARSELRLR